MKEAATLHVGQVREISVAQYRLDVANDPVEGDPFMFRLPAFRRAPRTSTRPRVPKNAAESGITT